MTESIHIRWRILIPGVCAEHDDMPARFLPHSGELWIHNGHSWQRLPDRPYVRSLREASLDAIEALMALDVQLSEVGVSHGAA